MPMRLNVEYCLVCSLSVEDPPNQAIQLADWLKGQLDIIQKYFEEFTVRSKR
jgi:hypothetical protein